MNTVDIFPWNEHFNTGLKIVDNQHKKLVEILNSLASHIAYNSKEDDLNNIFDELTNYTLYHFETEEAIWHKYLSNDPLNSEHKAVHQQFIDTVLKLKDEQSTRPLIELAEEALGFLARWLASHILETDRYMAYLIFSLKDGLDIDSAKEQAAQKMSGSTRLLIDIILSIYGTLSTNTLHLMRELKSHQKFEEDIDNQNNYRDLLLDLSTDFINLPLVDIDSNINNALEKMANFVNTDRAYIFNYDYDANTTTNTYEWCSEGITPQIEELKNVPMKYVPGWPETHAKGKYVLIKDVGALDEGPVREILFSQGVQSLVTFPLFENSKCTGFVGFDAVKVKHDFSSSEIAILEIFSKLLSNISDRKHKESELSRERNFHKTLFKAIPDLVWVKDVKGVYLSCNSRLESFFGAKEADIIGKTDYDFVDKSLADIFQLTDNKVMKSGQAHVNEEKNPFPNDGHKVFLQTTKVPMYDQKGNLNGVMGVSRDITSIKEIQNELEEEKNRFSLAIEGTQDGLFDWNIQTDELFYSELYETMLGYYVGERPKTADAWFGLLHPEDKERAKKNVQEYLDTKGKGIYEDTFRLRMKNNSWKWILGRGKAQFDINGKPLRFVGFNTDITDKKLLEQKLEKSYEMLHKLTENIPGAIFQYRLYPDGNSNFPYASKGMDDLYEISPEDIVQDASTLFKNIHPDDLSMVVSSLKESTETMKEFNLEHRVTLPKKGLRWVHVKATPEKLEDDSVLFHGFSSDITADKRKEENLILINKRLEQAELSGNAGSWEYNIDTQNYWGSDQTKIIFGMPKDTTTFTSQLVESCMTEPKRVHQSLVDLIEKGKEYNLEYEINPFDSSKTKIIASIATVEFDDSNKPLKVVGFLQDITERANLQKELQVEKNRFALAVEGSKDGLWDWNLQTNELLFGERFETMLGYDLGTLENNISTWFSLLHPDDNEKTNKIVQEYLAKKGEGYYECSFRLRAKDGSWRWILGRGKAHFDKQGKPLRFIGFNTDISLQKAHEIELINAKNKAQHYLDISGSLIIALDFNGLITLINSTGCSLLEASEDEIIGKNWFDEFLVSNDLKMVHDYFSELMKGNIKNNALTENNIRTLKGNIKLISWNNSLIYDDNRNIQGILASGRDITQERQVEEELILEKKRFQLAIDGSKDGLWDWNLITDEIFLSKRCETMLGYNGEDLPRSITSWRNLLHPEDKEQALKDVEEYLDTRGKETYDSSFRLRMKDGSWKWIQSRGRAEFDVDDKPLRFVGFTTDITDQHEYQNKLDHTAKHDSLTHLPNRFLLTELLTHAMHVTKRNYKQLALLFIDLDGFKAVNDSYGHDAGDKVLSEVALRMNAIVRESDILARLGGDEFVIVITGLDKREDVIPLLERLLHDLSSNINYNELRMHVSASIGVSFYPQSLDIGNEVLLRQADQAMYTAKSSGKNSYHFFDMEASLAHKENEENISSILEAINTNQFVLYYQPKVDMKKNKVLGFEALLRWNHPEKGLLYPDEFLPLIEKDSRVMIKLGKWVFENAFKQLSSWHSEGLNIMLSINVSSHEVEQDDFSLYLKNLFEKYPEIKENTIEIELLETAAFNNFEQVSKILKECQRLGVSIAVDDFGTGFSSLSYLKNFNMNTLKIDKSFIIDMLDSTSSISIIEASIGLSHAFNTEVVAEGVESEEHGKILLQLGCNIAQGYVIGKAMPAKNISEWIKSYKGFTSWTKIKPMTDEERSILYASIEHRNWINSIENFIKNKNKNLPNLDATSCYLGTWINNNTCKEFLEHPNFERLKVLHNELHNYAELLLLSDDNEKVLGIEKLRCLQQEIIENLESLKL